MKILCYVFVVTFLFESCTLLIGIKNPKQKSYQEIEKKAINFGVNAKRNFILDSTYIKGKIESGQCNSGPSKNLAQPLEVRIFNREGSLIGYRVNCQLTGFPNLNWNSYGYFDSIPTKLNTLKLDTSFTLQDDLPYYKTFKGNNVQISQFDAEYNIIIFWTVFMNKQSRQLIKQIKKIVSKYPESYAKLYYVNCETIFTRGIKKKEK